MDVTSLLNSNSSSAAGQQKGEKLGEKSASPPKNRTPWDAGGYSLPINTLMSTLSSGVQSVHDDDSHTENPRAELTSSASLQPIHDDDSRIDNSRTHSPNSPRHKFSDSRSSLSSFTSSHYSTTHSRFSSMSTVASSHLANSSNDKLQDSRRTTPQPQGLSSPITLNETRVRLSLSPTGSLAPLAVERRQSRQEPVSPIQDTTDAMSAANISSTAEETVAGRVKSSLRPGSPSDAILIKRTSTPSLRLDTGDVSNAEYKQQSSMYLSAPLEHHGHPSYTGGHTRHKRAVSAPDFPPTMITDFDRRGPVSFGATAEPTPPPSHHSDHQSPPGSMRYTIAPDTPPATTADLESQPVICMYIPNCDTGSQPRKAISHIFGRNKMCTRLIPQHVWVHYCRKHYQRSRYRNPKEYAKLQCDLVQQQIRRVHEWSEENLRRGDAGVVQDWGLAVRKREQKRLDDLGGASRKRRAATFDRNDSDEGENGDDLRGNPVPATAVPQWLLDFCGKGYSTKAILEIFSRLHREILDDSMSCFPDIEILPNIVVDQEEPKSPKGYTKRKPFHSGHKRSQSLGVAVKPQYYPQPSQDRRMSQPSMWGSGDIYAASPVQKRRRPNEEEYLEEPGMISYQRHRMSMDSGRRIQGLAHRPVFANIEEHQGDENDYREPQGRTMYYSHSPSPTSYRAPLPAPTPQRHGPSMAANLETNNENLHMTRRPLHQRSQSDIGSFQRGMAYGQVPPPSYNMSSNYQNPQPSMVHRGQEQVSGYSTYPQPQHPQHPQRYEGSVRQHPYADPRPMRPMSGPGHIRHQSTPMVQQHHHHQSQQMPCACEAQPVMHGYQYAQNAGSTLPPPARIVESPHSHNIYGSRR